MKPVRLAPEVLPELLATAEWYESHERGLSQRFLDEVAQALSVVGRRPSSCPRIEGTSEALEVQKCASSPSRT